MAPDMPRRVTVGEEVLGIMAQALHFAARHTGLPRGTRRRCGRPSGGRGLDEAAMLRCLRQDLPMSCLLHWLHQHFAELSKSTVLRLYHQLIVDIGVLEVLANERKSGVGTEAREPSFDKQVNRRLPPRQGKST